MSQQNFEPFSLLPFSYSQDDHYSSVHLPPDYDVGEINQDDLFSYNYPYGYSQVYAEINSVPHQPIQDCLASPFQSSHNLPSIDVQDTESTTQNQSVVSRLPVPSIDTNVHHYNDQYSPSYMPSVGTSVRSPNSSTSSGSWFPHSSTQLLWSSHNSPRTPSPSTPSISRNAIPSVLTIAARFPSAGRGPLIPQKLYRPHTLSDRRRYVDEVELEEPIMFIMQYPDECGIPLTDALTGKYMRLLGRDDPMFIQRGPSVSIRLRWPGYDSWSRQIPTKDFRSPPGPITRAKLAKNIARTVERFIKDKQKHHLNPEDSSWRVGPGCIRIEDLLLVGLEHVSKGSWQAHLRLARPFDPAA